VALSKLGTAAQEGAKFESYWDSLLALRMVDASLNAASEMSTRAWPHVNRNKVSTCTAHR